MHQPDLSGRVAAITGASSGIGEATAVTLARAGAAVSLAARRGDRIDELAKRIEAGRRPRARDRDRRHRRGAGQRVRHSHEGGARAPRHPRQQRGRDAARARDRRRHQRVAPDDRGEPARPPVLHARRAAHHGRAGQRPHRERVVGRGALRELRVGGLQPHQVRRQRLLGGAAPGGCAGQREGDRDRARLRRDGAARATTSTRWCVDAIEKMREEIGEPLEPEDIAEAILYAVGGPDRVAVNEVLVRPAGQRR